MYQAENQRVSKLKDDTKSKVQRNNSLKNERLTPRSSSSSSLSSASSSSARNISQLLRLRKQGNSSLIINLSTNDDKGQIALALALRASTNIKLSNIPSTQYQTISQLEPELDEIKSELANWKKGKHKNIPIEICLTKLRSIVRGAVDNPSHKDAVVHTCKEILSKDEDIFTESNCHYFVELMKDSAYYIGDELQYIFPEILARTLNFLEKSYQKKLDKSNFESSIIVFTLKTTNGEVISDVLKILASSYYAYNRTASNNTLDIVFILNKVLLILCIGKDKFLTSKHHTQLGSILEFGLQHSNKHVRQEMQFVYWKYQKSYMAKASVVHENLSTYYQHELETTGDTSMFTLKI